MKESGEITVEEGSSNVYADLGYADAAEMRALAKLTEPGPYIVALVSKSAPR